MDKFYTYCEYKHTFTMKYKRKCLNIDNLICFLLKILAI